MDKMVRPPAFNRPACPPPSPLPLLTPAPCPTHPAQVAQADGEVIITNDGATILNKMHVEQPAAKMLVELSKSQDVVAGDGTTSVVVLCGALLRKSLDLLERGVHPTITSDAFDLACREAVRLLETEVAIPVAVDDRESLLKAANTSLSSKIVSQHSALLSPMAVDCLLKVYDAQRPEFLDLKDVKVSAHSWAIFSPCPFLGAAVCAVGVGA